MTKCSYLFLGVLSALMGQTLWAQNPSFQEIRGGILTHDLNGSLKRGYERGLSLMGEYLFQSPNNAFFETIFAPHPHLGLLINSRGSTSFLYGGLTFHLPFSQTFFGEIALGGAMHNGEIKTKSSRRKNYGSRVLFQTSAAVGYRFTNIHSLSLTLQHFSNAGLCTLNPGVTDLGLRYGYRF